VPIPSAEVAVQEFLAGTVGFLDIARIVEQTLARVPRGPLGSLEDVKAADAAAREEARRLLAAR